MRWRDLIEMSLSSLRQRRFRTALTSLGVVIGTTSVVVMISLGLGMSKSLMESVSRNAGFTRVSVLPNAGSTKQYKLDTQTINDLSGKEGITRVTPVYEVTATARAGSRTGSVTVSAIPADALADRGLEFAQGRLPTREDGLAFAVGGRLGTAFGDDPTVTTSSIDFMAQPLFITVDPNQSQNGQTRSSGQSQNGSTAGAGNAGGQAGSGAGQGAEQARPGRLVVPVTGVTRVDRNNFSDQDAAIYCDFDELVAALRRTNPGKALPGQPANASGGPKGAFVYSRIDVDTGSVEQAEALTTQLRSEGYTVQSNVDLMKQIQQESATAQAVFGGIGFISLLVAAIGIANTMMMSVYERTRQIGIMKVLGAAISDIRKAFLIEAAAIGFLGGLIGLGLSMLLSVVLNATLGASLASAGGSGISVVTPWLAVGAVVFSTVIGTLAGFVPAQRATRLSPLAALRAE